MANYEVLVRFDDRTALPDAKEAYFKTQDKYGALGIGHEKTGTSSLLIETEGPLSRKELHRNLKPNRILQIQKY